MRLAGIGLAALLAAGPPAYAQRMLVLGAGGSFAGYQGPGDVVASANTWVSCARAYNAAWAAPGTNKACNIRRASDNTTQDILILSTGKFDIASYNTFVGTDATGTCTIATTTLSCTGLGSTLHANDLITGTGITNPCILSAPGSLVAGAQTATAQLAGTSTSCGTVSVGETVVAQVAGFVTKAYDQSGNANDMSQATSGLQPQLLPGCGNGIPCTYHIRGTPLDLTDGSGLSAATVWTISTVAQRTALFTSYSGIMGGASVGALFNNTANNTVVFQGNLTVLAAATDGAFHALQFIATGSTTSFVNVDGTPGSTGNAGSTALGATLVYGASNGNAMTGYIYEAGIWASNFSSTQNTNMHTNQSAFYGTP